MYHFLVSLVRSDSIAGHHMSENISDTSWSSRNVCMSPNWQFEIISSRVLFTLNYT